MAEFSHERFEEALRQYAAEFLSRESSRTSLITVTRVVLDKHGKHATIFFTVFPERMEEHALSFVMRMRSDLREFFAEKIPHRDIPQIEVAIDTGEKYRQHLDEISNH